MMSWIQLDALIIEKFRNFERVELALDKRFNVISGKNGSGKTNLLEAIYLLSALRSFRTTYRKELIKAEEERSRIKGVFGGATTGLVVEIELTASERKIKKHGKEVGSIAEHFIELPMVLFHPDNMALTQGGPKERRRFMDRALFQADKSYPVILTDYQRALTSRNRLLKKGFTERRMLTPYNAQLASFGVRVVEARKCFVNAAARIFAEAFESISMGLKGEIEYKPDVEGSEEEMMKTLDNSLESDRQRSYTTRGPHADELEIRVDGMLARRYASQGQQRLAVLSMKIAETMALKEVTSKTPVMLLDDISSELDRDRNRELFGFLKGIGGQVFITTTHIDHVLIEEDRTDYQVECGIIYR